MFKKFAQLMGAQPDALCATRYVCLNTSPCTSWGQKGYYKQCVQPDGVVESTVWTGNCC